MLERYLSLHPRVSASKESLAVQWHKLSIAFEVVAWFLFFLFTLTSVELIGVIYSRLKIPYPIIRQMSTVLWEIRKQSPALLEMLPELLLCYSDPVEKELY